MDTSLFIFSIIVFVFSVIIHEVSHGYVAYLQGDNTAKYAGRLTLNPLPHIDPLGSIVLPLLLVLTHAPFVIGWAKPVPYNPYNLKPQKWGLSQRTGEALVALAGPFSNICIAVVFGLFLRFSIFPQMAGAFVSIVIINLALATFNLVPIPPLDGSKILFSILPNSLFKVRVFFEKYSLAILIFFVLFLWGIISPLVGFEFTAITGLAF